MRRVIILLFFINLLTACTPKVIVQASPEKEMSHHPKPATQTAPIVAATPEQATASSKKLTTIPDFAAIHDIPKKKRAFFTWLTPIVQAENGRLMQLRRRLLKLRSLRTLRPKDLTFLRKLATDYRVTWRPEQMEWVQRQLRLRVDSVPLDLVLTQAAIESAWGQSRFAKEGNNLFGEWCFTAGCGLIPKRRNPNAHHEVRVFSSPKLAIRAYLHNINRGKSYIFLRRLRQKERQLQQPLSGSELALGLRTYSERGMAYVRQIRHLIRSHQALLTAQSSSQPLADN